MIEPDDLRQRIVTALPDAVVRLSDLTGSQDHYSVQVSSGAFAGLSPLQQHRLVYDALGDVMQGPLHAIQLRTSVP